jgi:hypothetical protein
VVTVAWSMCKVAWEKVWLSGMATGTEAGCHRIVAEEAVYPSLPDSPADGLGLIFLINEISWFLLQTPTHISFRPGCSYQMSPTQTFLQPNQLDHPSLQPGHSWPSQIPLFEPVNLNRFGSPTLFAVQSHTSRIGWTSTRNPSTMAGTRSRAIADIWFS